VLGGHDGRRDLARNLGLALLALGPIQAFDWVRRMSWLKAAVLIVLFFVSLATMATQAFNPFLYFQF